MLPPHRSLSTVLRLARTTRPHHPSEVPLFFRRGRKYSWVLLYTWLVFLRALAARMPLLGSRLFPRSHDWALS